jgi:hypothetical protein
MLDTALLMTRWALFVYFTFAQRSTIVPPLSFALSRHSLTRMIHNIALSHSHVNQAALSRLSSHRSLFPASNLLLRDNNLFCLRRISSPLTITHHEHQIFTDGHNTLLLIRSIIDIAPH